MAGKAQRTRQQIVASAATLFNQKGYSGTSLSDILAATGLSKGGLYGHFRGGKEELALASFDYAVQLTYELIGARTHTISHTLEKLVAVIDFYREHLFTPPVEGGCVIQNFSVETDDLLPALYQRVREVVADWESRIQHTLSKGVERGEIHPGVNPEEFAVFFIGTIEGGILMARLKGEVAPFDLLTAPLRERIEALRTS